VVTGNPRTSDLWLEDAVTTGTVKVIEGWVKDVVNNPVESVDLEGIGEVEVGQVLVAIDTYEVVELWDGDCDLWNLRVGTDDDREAVRKCCEMSADRARSDILQSERETAVFSDENLEKVMMVKLTSTCSHPPSQWEVRKCGHPWCPMCQGNVHPLSKVVLTGPGPIVGCNRQPASSYDYLFREGMAGSENLTAAMRKIFGKRVEEASDIIKGPQHDIRQKWVYEREKKRAKARTTLIDHWSPNCRTASRANRKPYRWKDEPYGHVQDDKLMDDSVIMVRVAKLAIIKHSVGDFFGIEHIYPTPMLEMDSYKELLALPGVFVLTWDNCMYGEDYMHRQCYITNMWFLAPLSRDCDKAYKTKMNMPTHSHDPVAPQSGPGRSTKSVQAFAVQWCEEYAFLVQDWVKSPQKDCCAVCKSYRPGELRDERETDAAAWE